MSRSVLAASRMYQEMISMGSAMVRRGALPQERFSTQLISRTAALHLPMDLLPSAKPAVWYGPVLHSDAIPRPHPVLLHSHTAFRSTASQVVPTHRISTG